MRVDAACLILSVLVTRALCHTATGELVRRNAGNEIYIKLSSTYDTMPELNSWPEKFDCSIRKQLKKRSEYQCFIQGDSILLSCPDLEQGSTKSATFALTVRPDSVVQKGKESLSKKSCHSTIEFYFPDIPASNFKFLRRYLLTAVFLILANLLVYVVMVYCTPKKTRAAIMMMINPKKRNKKREERKSHRPISKEKSVFKSTLLHNRY